MVDCKCQRKGFMVEEIEIQMPHLGFQKIDSLICCL